MTKKTTPIVLATLLSLTVLTGALAGCQATQPAGAQPEAQAEDQAASFDGGGELTLRVNPEFVLRYDEAGNVVDVTAVNDSAKTIALAPADYEGKEARAVVSWLVTKIHEAGMLVDVETGAGRTIHLDVSEGSTLPSDDFLRNIVSDTETYVVSQSVVAPMEVSGHESFGWTDYGDSDYGPENDGVTDYYDTDYGPLNDGATDYDDTDYGPNNDGVTDYGSTDYGAGSDGVTDYGDSAYGSGGASQGTSTPPATSTGGGSGSSGGSATAAPPATTTPTTPPATTTPPVTTTPPASGGGNSGYGDSGYGDSGYDSGNSGYGDSSYGSGDSGNSGYGDSGYDD